MPKASFNDPDQRQNATAQVLQRILSDNAALRIENQRLFNYAQQLEAEIAETTDADDPPEPAADAAPATPAAEAAPANGTDAPTA